MPTNGQRADTARSAFLFYARLKEESILDCRVDFLADLLHLYDESKWDFDNDLRIARDHYEVEKTERD